MKQIIFLLYLLSYTSGIGAITVFSFFYFKYRHSSIRLIIWSDLSFTLTLLVDTIHYYFRMMNPNPPEVMQLLFIFGLLLGSAGIVYFLAQLVHQSTGRGWGDRQQLIFGLSSGMVVTLICLFFVLFIKGWIPGHVAFHTGFSLSNAFIVAWFFYLAFVTLRGIVAFEPAVKSMIQAILAVSALILPMSLLANIVQFSFKLPFPLAFSPLEYFILNIIFIVAALRYFLGESEAKPAVLSELELSSPENLGDFVREYNISKRELEIIQGIIQGYNNPEIGAKLFISPNTVKNHVYNIFKKLGVKTRYELINLIIFYQNTRPISRDL